MNRRDVPFDEAGFEKNRLDTVENVSLLVNFFYFLGARVVFAKLNFGSKPKPFLSKNFLQIEQPSRLVVAPNSLPKFKQKGNSINSP